MERLFLAVDIDQAVELELAVEAGARQPYELSCLVPVPSGLPERPFESPTLRSQASFTPPSPVGLQRRV